MFLNSFYFSAFMVALKSQRYTGHIDSVGQDHQTKVFLSGDEALPGVPTLPVEVVLVDVAEAQRGVCELLRHGLGVFGVQDLVQHCHRREHLHGDAQLLVAQAGLRAHIHAQRVNTKCAYFPDSPHVQTISNFGMLEDCLFRSVPRDAVAVVGSRLTRPPCSWRLKSSAWYKLAAVW